MEASWMKMIRQADDYFGTVSRLSQTKRFRNETLYTIVCLSAEKLMLSYLISLGETPFNHSFSSLVRDMKPSLRGASAAIFTELQFVESFQPSKQYHYQRVIPSDEEMQRILNTLHTLHSWVFHQTKAALQ